MEYIITEKNWLVNEGGNVYLYRRRQNGNDLKEFRVQMGQVLRVVRTDVCYMFLIYICIRFLLFKGFRGWWVNFLQWPELFFYTGIGLNLGSCRWRCSQDGGRRRLELDQSKDWSWEQKLITIKPWENKMSISSDDGRTVKRRQRKTCLEEISWSNAWWFHNCHEVPSFGLISKIHASLWSMHVRLEYLA